ncbi:MAG TPA: malectin domain-containing carbohydrate-binding protein [Terriglobales bacterium]|nr:malectin domain-containing carbohydrate-binding protein [Terriglobales bacterium]
MSIGEGAQAQSPVTVTLSPGSPGAAIPNDYIGLSYETGSINGGNYFRPTNQPLLQVFSTLGIKSLRFGGNTSDSGTPANADLDNMFGFAKAAGIPVVYTLRLKGSSPGAAATTAGFLWGKYSSSITCFSIGNEPDLYIGSYATYASDVSAYMSAVGPVAPGAKFCPPDTSRHNTSWVGQTANQFGTAKLAHVTHHVYPGGSGATTCCAAARDTLLGTGIFGEYNSQYSGSVPTAAGDGLLLRLSETNSFVHGGAPNASNTFASALWGLDYMYWWTTQQDMLGGVNFHTGDSVASGPPNYAVFLSTAGGYSMHPLGYGIKAFDLGGHGRVVHAALNNPSAVDLTAYGVLAADNSLWVTVINKSHDASATTVNLTIQSGGSYNQAAEWVLQAPNNDVSQTTGVTLGGAGFNVDGTWNGTSTPVAISGGNVSLTMPPATAVVVQLQPGGATVVQPPTNLVATQTSPTTINATWTASTTSGATYNIYRSTTPGFIPSAGNRIASGLTVTNFSDTVQANTMYCYLATAESNGMESAPSNQSCAGGTVPPQGVSINAGGPAVAPFIADTDFTGGVTINHANTINLNGQPNPAPTAVYQSARVTTTAGAGTSFTYKIPNLGAGSSHTVRLHFCETFWTAAGKRVFNVSINGTAVLSNFDIFAGAGGQNRALIKQFSATADGTGNITIVFTTVTDKALISGIEIQ